MTHSVIYQQYFDFSAPPFSIAPNPHYLFMTQRHQDALAHLLYGLQSDGGFVLLTGEVGTGKTTICRCFLEQLPDDTDVAFIVSPCLSPKELLFAIHKDLEIPRTKKNKKSLTFWDSIELIYEFLLANHAKGRNTVLIIDEAQHLNAKMLELIRLLTNLETNTTKLLQVILIGQPELNDTLAKPELRQLSQRITARYHIDPLRIKDTINYIWHRLKVSGNHHGRDIFPLLIIKKIHQQTSGIPRLINVLCDRALLGAYSHNEKQVTAVVLKQSIKEVEGNYTLPKTRWFSQLPWHYVAAGLAACMLLFIGALWLPTDDTVDNLDKTELAAGVIARSPKPLTTLAEANTNIDVKSAANATNKTITQPYIASQKQALSALLKQLDPKITFTTQNCQSLLVSSWRCAQASAKGVDALLTINRPSMVQLSSAQQPNNYAVIIKVIDEVAYIMNVGQAQQSSLEVSLSDLKQQWDGQFTYLWQPPLGFSKTIKVGDRGPTVEWLTESFALIDDRDGFFEDGVFNQFLESRVKLFQKNHNLFADGIVGAQTILKIQEVLGVAAPLLTGADDSVVNVVEGG